MPTPCWTVAFDVVRQDAVEIPLQAKDYLYKPRITSSILRIGQATLRWFDRVVQNGMMVGFTGLFPRNSEMTLGNVLLCANTLAASRVK